MDNLEEMGKFQEMYHLPSLNQERENTNRPTTSNEIKLVIKKNPNKQKSRRRQVNSTKHLKKS